MAAFKHGSATRHMLAMAGLFATAAMTGCGGSSSSSSDPKNDIMLSLNNENAAVVAALTFGAAPALSSQLDNLMSDVSEYDACVDESGSVTSSSGETSRPFLQRAYTDCIVSRSIFAPDDWYTLTLDGAMRMEADSETSEFPMQITASAYSHTNASAYKNHFHTRQFSLEGQGTIDGTLRHFMNLSDMNMRLIASEHSGDGTDESIQRVEWLLTDFSMSAEALGSGDLSIAMEGLVYLGAPQNGQVRITTPVPVSLMEPDCHGHIVIEGGQGTSLDILLSGEDATVTLNGVTQPISSCEALSDWIFEAVPSLLLPK